MDNKKKKIYSSLYYTLLEDIFDKIINNLIESNNLLNLRNKLKPYNKVIFEKFLDKIDDLIWNKYEYQYNYWFNKYYNSYHNDIQKFNEKCYNKFANSFINVIEQNMKSEIVEELYDKLNLIAKNESLETHQNQNKDNNQSHLTNDETNSNSKYDNNPEDIEDENKKSIQEEMEDNKNQYPPINKKSKIDEQDNNKGNLKISLGINIGSLNTVYSKFDKNDGKFKTNVLLSDVSKRIIPSQICYSNTHRLYGDTASALMKKFGEFSYTIFQD